jgi:N-methylhydantoinase A
VRPVLLGVDVGGTFTDAVLAVDGRLITAKAPTTPEDQSEGVLAAVSAVLERAGADASAVAEFSHGMTVATNALLEGRGARTAFIATEGFTDIVALGRQDRPELYRLCAARPQPLTEPEARFGAPERMTPDGPLRELSDDDAAELARRIAGAEADGFESVAVCLLHAYRHPQHEQAIGRALAAARGDRDRLHVSLSHEVVGTFREFERASTTEVDAALSPLVGGYLRRLVARCDEAELPEPAIMQSSGGLIDLEAAASHAAWTVLSGPAGGAAGAAFIARASGAPDAVCFDMGGTSCDVCVVDDGAVQEESAGTIARRPLALPMVAVHTVGAGGGSIAWRDAGGALRVGPRSAGADPGPACYGRGGTEPTVTDANLVLGYLSGDAPLAGGVALDREAAETAVGELADALELEPLACAEGIIRVANAEMVRALRVVTVQRGIDPRRYALLAFGGAGPMHAAAIAAELGITHIVCPRASGVLAALGLVVSPRRRDVQRSVFLSGDALSAEAVAEVVTELGAAAREQLHESPDDSDAARSGEAGRRAGGKSEAELRAVYELRYRGQAFELAVDGALEPEPAELREAFEALHEERYGYRDAEQELELVTLRVSATMPGAEVSLNEAAGGQDQAGDDEAPERTTRTATLDGAEAELAVLRGSPGVGGIPVGTTIEGPAVIELPESTLLVPEGWAGEVDDTGTIHIRTDTQPEA